jgi:hypothetical protein
MDKTIEENIVLAYQTGMHTRITMTDGASVEGVIEGRHEDGDGVVVRVLVVCDVSEIAKVELFSPADREDWLKGSEEE